MYSVGVVESTENGGTGDMICSSTHATLIDHVIAYLYSEIVVEL